MRWPLPGKLKLGHNNTTIYEYEKCNSITWKGVAIQADTGCVLGADIKWIWTGNRWGKKTFCSVERQFWLNVLIAMTLVCIFEMESCFSNHNVDDHCTTNSFTFQPPHLGCLNEYDVWFIPAIHGSTSTTHVRFESLVRGDCKHRARMRNTNLKPS